MIQVATGSVLPRKTRYFFHAAFRQVQVEVGLLSRSSDRPRCSRQNPRQMSQTKNCEAVIENKLYLAKSVTLII